MTGNIYFNECTYPDLRIRCMEICIDDAPIFKELSHLEPELRVPGEAMLRNTLEKMKNDHSVE
eukprot:jgi/Orpsp1_1/1178341/evm.model.c7180000064925.1